MKSLCLLLGVVVGWAASGVDWSREAVGQVTDSITGKPINSYDGDASLDLKTTSQEVSLDFSKERSAAPDTSRLVGRFQASAYGSPNGHGCFVVDTMTGKTWHVAIGQQSQVVTEALVQQAPTQNPLATPAYNQPAGMVVAPTPSYYDEPPQSPQKSNVVPAPAQPGPNDAE